MSINESKCSAANPFVFNDKCEAFLVIVKATLTSVDDSLHLLSVLLSPE